jgi:phage terminase large subunit GpA-like protein
MKLNALLNRLYPSVPRVKFPIFGYAIDSGYATGDVYSFVRKFGGDRAIVIKGDSRGAAPVSQPSTVDVGPQGKNLKFGVCVWPVNGSMIKEERYRWLRLDRPTEESGEPYPSRCHFPKYSQEYFKQITAEQLVTKVVKGYRRTEWQKTRDRNESLDCRS